VALFRALELTNKKGRFVVKAKFLLFFCIGQVGFSVQMPSALSADRQQCLDAHLLGLRPSRTTPSFISVLMRLWPIGFEI
jgi:hypothetical protein